MSEDLRVTKTKKAIMETFKEMLLELDYNSINVKSLCDKALINRRTFYLHYDSLDDLLYELQEQLSVHFFEVTKDYDHIKDADKIVRAYFEETNNNPILEIINNNLDFDYIREQMKNKVGKMADNNFKSIEKYDIFTRKIIVNYYNYATVGMYRQWCKDGKKLSLNHVIDIATGLIQNGLKSII